MIIHIQKRNKKKKRKTKIGPKDKKKIFVYTEEKASSAEHIVQ